MEIAGIWTGFYEYGLGYELPFFGERVEFTAKITGTVDEFYGSIAEKPSQFSTSQETKIKGFISDEGLISFVKFYENQEFIKADYTGIEVDDSKGLEIRYTGQFDEKRNCFFGIWEIFEEFEHEGEWFQRECEGIWLMKK